MAKASKKTKSRFINTSLIVGLSFLASTSSMAAERSAFVHLFEWTWNDIAQECEAVLGPKGYAAVQISPPNEVKENGVWWGRYQPISYEFGNSLGSRQELEDMIKRCNAVDVEIYMDTVINHMVGGGSKVPFSNDDFHHDGTINNYQDRDNVQNGALLGLNDLNTGSDYVQQKIADYMNDAQSMGITGFRMDAAKHIAATDMEGIIDKLDGNPYVFQEVIGNSKEPIKPTEYTHIGSVTEFYFEFTMGDKFQKGGISQLKGLESGWLPSDKAVIFVDNHDDQRQHEYSTLTYNDGAELYKLGNIFMLAYPYGYPKVISGFKLNGDPGGFNDQGFPQGGVHSGNSCIADGGDWVCTHRWSGVANMVDFRNQTQGQPLKNWWDNSHNQIAFGRGNKGFVVINRDESASINQTLQTGLAEGSYCDVISGDDCSISIDVDSGGMASFSVASLSAVAIYVGGAPSGDPLAKIAGAVARVDVGTAVTLDGSNSSDPDGTVVSYSWSTGETTSSISKTLTKEGDNEFTLTVKDNDGNSSSKTVTIFVGDAPASSKFKALNFRGTANAWKATAMTLVADNTWQLAVEFDGQKDQRFKLDESTTWLSAWGDVDEDGILDQAEKNDIVTDLVGRYLLTVNDLTKSYTLVNNTVDTAPIAVISPEVKKVNVGDSIKFSAAQSSDDNSVLSYLWNTGESTDAIDVKFDEIGVQTVSVTVTDSAGQTAMASATVTVEKININVDQFPIAKLSPMTQTITLGQMASLSAEDSSDDKGAVSYLWSTNATSSSIEATFDTVGTHSISVTVIDSAGQTDTMTATVMVESTKDELPKALISPLNKTIKVGETLTLSAVNSSDDQGSVKYLWSTGEQTETIEVSYSESGDYEVKLTVTDNNNQTDSASISISVVDELSTPGTKTSSSGGSISWFSLISLLFIMRRKQRQKVQ